MFRGSRAKQRAEEEEVEPQSPKVTCAGQIKVGRPKKVKPGPGSTAAAKHGKDGVGVGVGDARSWITVVEEIERLHGRRKKQVGWLETLGIRRDALPFLGAALRSLRFKARCFGFGSLHAAPTVDSSVDSDDPGERGISEHGAGGSAAASVFSKWLMVLEGGQEPTDLEQDEDRYDDERDQEEDVEVERQQGKETDEGTNGPPPNALLLMRCRSAPAKGLSMSRRRTCEQLAGEFVDQEKGAAADGVPGDGETEEDKEEELVFMSTAPGFMKLSLDIAKETWIVGGGDPIARCRSWKR